MLITPERVRVLRDQALRAGQATVVEACDAVARAGSRGEDDADAETRCAAALESWRATPISAEPPTERTIDQEQISDLQDYAIAAGDRHAYRVCQAALRPSQMQWIPTSKEIAAAATCAEAWDARAARLRRAGVPPWTDETPDPRAG